MGLYSIRVQSHTDLMDTFSYTSTHTHTRLSDDWRLGVHTLVSMETSGLRPLIRSVVRRPAGGAPLTCGEPSGCGLEPESADSRSTEVALTRRDSAITVVLVLTPADDCRPHRVSCRTEWPPSLYCIVFDN